MVHGCRLEVGEIVTVEEVWIKTDIVDKNFDSEDVGEEIVNRL